MSERCDDDVLHEKIADSIVALKPRFTEHSDPIPRYGHRVGVVVVALKPHR
jgi:hypothetical protein